MADDDFIDDSALTARADALIAGMPAVPTHAPTCPELALLQSKGGKAARAAQKEKKQDDMVAEKQALAAQLFKDWTDETVVSKKFILRGKIEEVKEEWGAARMILDKFTKDASMKAASLAEAKCRRDERVLAEGNAVAEARKKVKRSQRGDGAQLFSAINALVRACPTPPACLTGPESLDARAL